MCADIDLNYNSFPKQYVVLICWFQYEPLTNFCLLEICDGSSTKTSGTGNTHVNNITVKGRMIQKYFLGS